MSAQGVCITDANGRRILSTHFQNPLRAALAVDAAMASRAAITWVPSLDGDYPRGGAAEASGGEDGRPWASASRGGGHAVVQLERDGLHFIAPVASDVDPILQLTILNKLYEVLVSYIGPVTEASLKDHFDVVLEVLEEMLAAGRPLMSEPSQLRELVVPPAQLLAKVAQNAVNVAGLSASTVPGTNALLSSPLPWRRTGIKYSSNDIYFDVAESLDYLLDSQGKVVTGAVTGDISCRSRLSGMPDLTLSFTDPSQLEDCAFNSSVRYARWNKSKVVSFIPPDGAFSLMSFSIGGPSKTGSALSSNPLLTLLPLSIRNTVTTGPLGSTFAFSITSRVPSSRPLTNIVLRFPLGKGANSVTGTASGGAYPRSSGSSSASAGAGRWEVETEEEGRSQVLVWKIAELVSTDRPAILQGQFLSAIGSKPSPAVTITFDCPSSGFSGLRIAGLQVSGEAYSIYKGVRLTGKGKVEVRCV